MNVMEPFRNEPFTNFALEHNRQAFTEALAAVKAEWGKHYPLIINGKPITAGNVLPSINPSEHAQIAGYVSQADVPLMNQAIEGAGGAFAAWRHEKPLFRIGVLYKAAALMRRRRHWFSAWLVYEAGKTWVEADVETAEAIDFLNYYAAEAERLLLHPTKLVDYPGEYNEWSYVPLGVGAVIPPWNFPLAIMAGMTAAAVVCGNTVVLKPASATPIIAYHFAALLEEAGLPGGIVQYVPGPGKLVGDRMATHPLIRFINFTGSMEVGLGINEKAALRSPGQRWLRRVTAELGGKDGIVVDDNADIGEAAEAVVQSAFGYSGQKCSACSRAIVHKAVYDVFLEEVVRRTGLLKVGPADAFDTNVGAVIDRAAFDKIAAYMELAAEEGTIVCGGAGSMDPSAGYYTGPTVVAGVDPQARIAQEEIFGPVLAVIPADDFEHALEIANGTPYGLTGSVYSRNRAHLELARAKFHVGNLYFNRKCTGALVGVHPFGGFDLSGTDSKAGGPDYLLQFLQAKVITERM